MKILFLLSRIPYPINKGDKLRAFHQIRLLSKKHNIHLIALDEEKIDKYDDVFELNKYCSSIKIIRLSKITILSNLFLGIFKNIPFQTSYFFSKKIKSIIKEEIKKHNHDIIFCQMIRMAEYVIDYNQMPKIIDYVDVISKGLERRILDANLLFRVLLKIENNRVIKYEQKVNQKFDKKIIITAQDKELLPISDDSEIEVIPNGIDATYFKPIEVEKEYDILFTGNLSYPPNVTACMIIAKKILPMLKKLKPNIKILLLGSSPSHAVLSLKSENVQVSGWVEDIREYYSKAKTFVAPMMIGTGLQNKILEAMAMELPCITTKLVEKGLNTKIGEKIIVAQNEIEFANEIINLIDNPNVAVSIGKKARQFIINKYNWESVEEKLNNLITQCLNP